MTKDRRLGRGLAALLGSVDEAEFGASVANDPHAFHAERAPADDELAPAAPPAERSADADAAESRGELLMLNVQEVDENPFQPRRDFSEAEIASLAESLKQHDLLQPILVRRVHGRYQLISGERRLRAAIRAGWTSIPARVRDADDRLVAELAIVENLQRKDLNPVEKALSFKRYLDEHRCTQDELAQRLSIDRSTIANLMRLLELPAPILDSLRSGDLSAGHARAMLPLGDEREQLALARRVQEEQLSVRAVEQFVQQALAADEAAETSAPAAPGRKKRTRTEQIASLEQEFRVALGTKVEIRASARGRGQIIVHFHSHDEFDRLRDLLSGGDEQPARRAA